MNHTNIFRTIKILYSTNFREQVQEMVFFFLIYLPMQFLLYGIQKKAQSRTDFYLKTIQTHGLWDNQNPFKSSIVDYDKDDKIAIITRGKIKLSKQIDFWLNVPKASNAIKVAEGGEFYKGIGELPLMAQATFSIWKNIDAVKNFAYKSKAHSDIIKKTKQRNWYSEDMFTRFIITDKVDKYYK